MKPTHYAVPEALVEQVGRYLLTQPMGAVEGLVQALRGCQPLVFTEPGKPPVEVEPEARKATVQ